MIRSLFMFCSAMLVFSCAAQASDLSVRIKGLRNSTGPVLLSVFDRADGFPGQADRAVRIVRLPASGNDVIAQFTGLVPGNYAFAFVHDENNNGKLDTNGIGIPKEGFGFSNDPKLTFGAPSFEKCAFPVSGATTKVQATMKYY